MTIFATIIRVSLFKAWTFFNKSKGRTRNDRDTVLPPYCHHAHVKGGGLELLKTAAKRRNFIGLTKQRFFFTVWRGHDQNLLISIYCEYREMY